MKALLQIMQGYGWCDLSMWSFNSSRDGSSSLHNSQIAVIIWRRCTCFDKLNSLESSLKQYSQRCDLTGLPWNLMWRSSTALLMKLSWHSMHLKGLSPVWVVLCTTKEAISLLWINRHSEKYSRSSTRSVASFRPQTSQIQSIPVCISMWR